MEGGGKLLVIDSLSVFFFSPWNGIGIGMTDCGAVG